jgi:hypothetical protein
MYVNPAERWAFYIVNSGTVLDEAARHSNIHLHLKLVTHQQMHCLLNLEGFKFTLEFT